MKINEFEVKSPNANWKHIKCLNKNKYSQIDIICDDNNERIIKKTYYKFDEKNYSFGMNEFKIVSKLNHPNVIKFNSLHQTNDEVIITMPLYSRDLYNKIEIDLDSSYFNSPSAISERITIISKVFDSIRYLHNLDYVHLDLKPENILLDDDEPILIDFGFSMKIENNNRLTSRRGTILYAAPEVMDGKMYLGKPADIFSLGVTGWCVIFGCKPWNDNRNNDFYKTFNVPMNNILHELKDLLIRMTDVDPDKRPTINEAYQRIEEINIKYFSCNDVVNEYLILY